MTLPARVARDAKRLSRIDEAAKLAGTYPLTETERQRRAGIALKLEMARVRGAKRRTRNGDNY